MTTERARDSDPTGGGAIDGAVVEEGFHGPKQDDIGRKDSYPPVSDANVVENGEAVFEGGVMGSDGACGEALPRKRLLRQWPSSADIGMVTDGR